MTIHSTPQHNATILQVFAFRLAFSAPSMSPLMNFPLTLAEFTIPTIPNGRQQNTVVKIENNRYVGGQTLLGWLGYAGASGWIVGCAGSQHSVAASFPQFGQNFTSS